MSVTIKDVARHAGVSVATVSRYMNKSPLIAPESALKVEKSMEALHYQPSFIARSMLRQSSQTIAFAVDSENAATFGNDYFLRIQYGIERALAENGYYLMIINICDDEEENGNLQRIIMEKRVDGVILPSEIVKPETAAFLQSQDAPFVIFGRSTLENGTWLDLDNTMGGRIAAEKLISAGARRIAFVTSSLEKTFVSDRFAGYREVMKTKGIFCEEDVFFGLNTSADGFAFMREQCEKGLFDAYIVTDNLVAFGMLKALSDSTLRVPEDVQVISFDKNVVAELSTPELSVIDVDIDQLGRQAASLLLSQLENPAGNECTHCLMPVRLMEGGSTR